MASKRPDRRLFLKKLFPRGVGVYQITELDDSDTIEFADFDSGEAIESAMIVNADTGAEITQAAIALNVLEVNDGTVDDTRVWIFIVGKLAP